MIEAREYLGAFMEEVSAMALAVDSEVADREKDPRSMCFWNIRNRTLIAQETLAFYYRAWAGHGLMEEEMSERIMVVTRNLFVDVVSSVEKGAKDSVKIYQPYGMLKTVNVRSGRAHLREIIWASTDLGIIDEKDSKTWDGILLMRNLAIHNNSVSDRSCVLMLEGLKISMRPDRMMKGPLSTFIVLSSMTVTLFYRWLMSMHKGCRWARRSYGRTSIGRIRGHGGAHPRYRFPARGRPWSWDAETERPLLPC